MHNFAMRLGVSSIIVPLLILAIFFSYREPFPLIFTGLVAFLVGFSLWEFYTLSQKKGYQPLTWMGIGWNVVFLFVAYWETRSSSPIFYTYFLLILSLASVCLYYFWRESSPLLNIGVTMLGLLYLTLPLRSILHINYFFFPSEIQDGRWWLAYLLLITKMTDTGAYFCGKMYGKTRLAPRMSPQKTVEGAMGGLITALLVSLLFFWGINYSFATPPIDITFWESLFLGSIISVLTLFGDLVESLFKRDVGIKDSNQIPGLGGMLDMIDSLVFTAPLVAFYLSWQYGG